MANFFYVLSLPWLNELESVVVKLPVFLIIAGIGYIPGYINAFVVMSLIFDKQPKFITICPCDDVTIIVAYRNEEKQIIQTQYIAQHDYEGSVHVILVDNAFTDETYRVAKESGKKLGVDLFVVREDNPGKLNALNKALNYVVTDYVMTLNADTLLHKSAVRYIVSRIKSAPEEVCDVAGSVLIKNSRTSFIARLQELDYFLE